MEDCCRCDLLSDDELRDAVEILERLNREVPLESATEGDVARTMKVERRDGLSFDDAVYLTIAERGALSLGLRTLPCGMQRFGRVFRLDTSTKSLIEHWLVYQAHSYTYKESMTRIAESSEIRSEEELRSELCNLLESAHRNGVRIGPISTWVC